MALFFSVGGLGAGVTQAASLVTFDWDPVELILSNKPLQASVDLLVLQSDAADAAGLTVGFTLSGIVTAVELDEWGPQVSGSDSFFGDIGGGEIALIAAAPSDPGSFGVDVDVDPVATLLFTLDWGLGERGTVTLKDLSDLAGPPALEMDGATSIPADLSKELIITPEPETSALLALGLVGLAVGAPRAAPTRET